MWRKMGISVGEIENRYVIVDESSCVIEWKWMKSSMLEWVIANVFEWVLVQIYPHFAMLLYRIKNSVPKATLLYAVLRKYKHVQQCWMQRAQLQRNRMQHNACCLQDVIERHLAPSFLITHATICSIMTDDSQINTDSLLKTVL